MRTRTVVLALALGLLASAVCVAQGLEIGTWTLNEAKSKIGPGAVKNTTVIYEMAGDMVKVTVKGVDSKGNAVGSEWTGKFDGKPYPVTGSATADSRTYMRVNKSTLTFVEKKGSKVVTRGRIVVSADGKTRTVTASGIDAMGKRFHTMGVYDKQ